jgi:hypothetical protein
MRVERSTLVVCTGKAGCTEGVRLRLSEFKRLVWMLEFNMDSQNTTGTVPKKKYCVRLETLATANSASAMTVAATPVVGPKWLFGRFGSPSAAPLFLDQNIRSFVI